MYCVCKFSGAWSVYDGNNKVTRPLTPPESQCIEGLFSVLLNASATMLDAIMIDAVPPNKLKRLPLFISCFPDKYLLHEQKTKSTPELTKEQANILKSVIPGLLVPTEEPLVTLQVCSIPVNKLMQLPLLESRAGSKPLADPNPRHAGKAGEAS